MLEQSRLPISTANEEQSVWRDLDQDLFRKHIVDLQRAANEVPADPVVHSATKWQASHTGKSSQPRLLPLETEQQVADDLAFVAAAEEGHKEISAVTIEERTEPRGLTVRLAANEFISQHVKDALNAMFDVLHRCASRKLSRNDCAQSLFDLVVDVNKNRILGRLESVHWRIPKSRIGANSRRPLYEGTRRLSSDLERPQSTDLARSALLVERTTQLSNTLLKVEGSGRNTNEGRNALKDAVKHVHELCTSGSGSTLEQTISNYSLQSIQATSHKTVRRLDKIGRYWGLCISLAQESRKYADMFTNIRLEPQPPYEGMTSKMAFLPGMRARCLVHAEIQLLVFYSKKTNVHIQKPRVIGVSKSCCYLCNLFIIKDGQHFITKTHGRLYERWNFPDLIDFAVTERERFCSILRAIDEELQVRFKIESKKPGKRAHPMGSWLTLPAARESSPVPSTILSLVPEEGDVAGAPKVGTTSPSHLGIQSSASPPISDISAAIVETEVLPFAHTEAIPSNPGSTCSTRDWNDQSDTSECRSERTVTSNSPVRSRIGGTVVIFEIGGPARGKVAMTRIRDEEQSNTDITIDLQTMKDGAIRHFDRRDSEDNVVFNLRHSNGQSTHIALQWS